MLWKMKKLKFLSGNILNVKIMGEKRQFGNMSGCKNPLGRVSQPFLDRIDICMEAPRVDYETLRGKNKEEPSALIRERVVAARNIQRKRYENLGIYTNGALDAKNIESFCKLGKKEEKIMKQAYESLGLTARTYHKILKVARTIADLSESRDILEEHLMEAMGYRTMDKKYWGR